MLALLTQKHRARIAVDNQITPSLRRDAWAAAAIVDRAAGSYLRGYVVTAALVGLLVYVGTQLSPRIGGPDVRAAAGPRDVRRRDPGRARRRDDPRPDPGAPHAAVVPRTCRRVPGDLRRRPDHRLDDPRLAADEPEHRRPPGDPRAGRRPDRPVRDPLAPPLRADRGDRRRPRALHPRPAVRAAAAGRRPAPRADAGGGPDGARAAGRARRPTGPALRRRRSRPAPLPRRPSRRPSSPDPGEVDRWPTTSPSRPPPRRRRRPGPAGGRDGGARDPADPGPGSAAGRRRRAVDDRLRGPPADHRPAPAGAAHPQRARDRAA